MISQPVSSIFPCSPLPSGTCRTPGLSIPWCCFPTSFSVCLVFFPLSMCLARWFWPDFINSRHLYVHQQLICFDTIFLIKCNTICLRNYMEHEKKAIYKLFSLDVFFHFLFLFLALQLIKTLASVLKSAFGSTRLSGWIRIHLSDWLYTVSTLFSNYKITRANIRKPCVLIDFTYLSEQPWQSSNKTKKNCKPSISAYVECIGPWSSDR